MLYCKRSLPGTPVHDWDENVQLESTFPPKILGLDIMRGLEPIRFNVRPSLDDATV